MFFFKRNCLIQDSNNLENYHSVSNEKNTISFDESMETPSNLFTCTLNTSNTMNQFDSNSDRNLEDGNNAKVIVEPIEYVSIGDIVDRDSTVYKGNNVQITTPLSNVKRTNIKLNEAVVSLKSNTNDFFKTNNEVTINSNENTLNHEFDEALNNLRKSDLAMYTAENLSLSLIDDFFGKLKEDDCSKINNLEESVSNNHESQLMEQIEKFDNCDKEEKQKNPEISAGTFDDSYKKKVIQKNCYITEEKNAAITNVNKITQNSTKNEVGVRENIKITHKDYNNSYINISTDMLQYANSSNEIYMINNENGKIDSVKFNEKDPILFKSLDTSKVNENINNIPEIIIIDENDDGSEAQTLEVKPGFIIETIDLTEDSFNKGIETQSESDTISYHSSHFEFISESDAELDMPLSYFTHSHDETSNNNGPTRCCLNDRNGLINVQNEEWIMQNEGNVQNNELEFQVEEINIPNDEINVERHEIPQGEAYLDLFRGIYDPVLPFPAIYLLENKSFHPVSMDPEIRGIGFDMRLMRREYSSSEDEDHEESYRTRGKILSTYPEENKRTRRTY